MSISTGINLLNNKLTAITEESGVYKMLNDSREVIYVGKAKNLNKRIRQYTQIERLPNRIRLMVSLIADLELLVTNSENEALLLEAQLIKSLQPKFNIALKDDKSFPYISISEKQGFPRIFKYRGLKKEGYIYFGPFLKGEELEDLIINIQKVTKLRSCSDNYFIRRQRPCLLYQISRCSAPCVGKIGMDQYKKDVKLAKKILMGDIVSIRNDMVKKMEEASKDLNFEKAAEIRDSIRALSQIGNQNFYDTEDGYDVDVIAFASYQERSSIQIFFIRSDCEISHESFFLEQISENKDETISNFLFSYYSNNKVPKKLIMSYGQCFKKNDIEDILHTKIFHIDQFGNYNNLYNIAKKSAESYLQDHIKNDQVTHEILERLEKVFFLKRTVKRIEVYDNSHIQGTDPVGCMIVSDSKNFCKEEYRIFKINKVASGDDYGMMREVLERRFSKLQKIQSPELIMIDGGENHLRVAQDTLSKFGILGDIRVVAIAKGVKRNAGEETFYLDNGEIIKFIKNDPVLYYLQKLRDEAHRFAITAHRRLRRKRISVSMLDDIPGIGLARKRMLLSVFGSYERVIKASLEEINNLPGFGKKFALKVYDYLHNKKDV